MSAKSLATALSVMGSTEEMGIDLAATQGADMTEEAKHTPTPWRYFDALGAIYVVSSVENFDFNDTPHSQHVALMTKNYGANTGSVREGREAVNAAFIVKAVNSHAELLTAAQAVIRQWDTPNWKLDEPTAVFINRLRAAIEAAS